MVSPSVLMSSSAGVGMSSSPLANTPDPLPNGFQVGVVRASCGVQLSPEKAVEIYKEKLARSVPKTFHASLQSLNARIRGQSVPLAIRYGVSPKTIRDIWNRKSWAFATYQLWEQEDGAITAASSRWEGTVMVDGAYNSSTRGRPNTSRDRIPRLGSDRNPADSLTNTSSPSDLNLYHNSKFRREDSRFETDSYTQTHDPRSAPPCIAPYFIPFLQTNSNDAATSESPLSRYGAHHVFQESELRTGAEDEAQAVQVRAGGLAPGTAGPSLVRFPGQPGQSLGPNRTHSDWVQSWFDSQSRSPLAGPGRSAVPAHLDDLLPVTGRLTPSRSDHCLRPYLQAPLPVPVAAAATVTAAAADVPGLCVALGPSPFLASHWHRSQQLQVEFIGNISESDSACDSESNSESRSESVATPKLAGCPGGPGLAGGAVPKLESDSELDPFSMDWMPWPGSKPQAGDSDGEGDGRGGPEPALNLSVLIALLAQGWPGATTSESP